MKELFDDKSIAIVGNAESLFKHSFGKEIDSHDTVVRINRSATICFTKKYRSLGKTHGIKTTVWAFSFADTMKSPLNKNHEKAEYLIQMNDASKNKIEYSFDFDSIQNSEIIDLRERFNRLHNEPEKNYAPSTGLRVLNYVSKYSPSKVDVYGFDWKETPTFYDIKKQTRQLEMYHNHNYFLEMEYCKQFFDSFNFKGV